MKVLLSIKPEFAEKIFSGEKKYEYRKILFKRDDVTTVLVYVTMPVGKIVGEFEIDDVIVGEPKYIWEKTREFSGVSKKFFSQYFVGREKGYAIKIRRVREYNSYIDPYKDGPFTPPQSFRYIMS